MSWFCLKANWISCTVASLIDEKAWAALMAWAVDDVVARRIRSSDEKTVRLSGEYLVAMEVSTLNSWSRLKSLRVFYIRAACFFFKVRSLGPLDRSHRTFDGYKKT